MPTSEILLKKENLYQTNKSAQNQKFYIKVSTINRYIIKLVQSEYKLYWVLTPDTIQLYQTRKFRHPNEPENLYWTTVSHYLFSISIVVSMIKISKWWIKANFLQGKILFCQTWKFKLLPKPLMGHMIMHMLFTPAQMTSWSRINVRNRSAFPLFFFSSVHKTRKPDKDGVTSTDCKTCITLQFHLCNSTL